MAPKKGDRGLASRFLGGPALRVQPDGRLVSLVRDGYDSAFEEIFRRYGAALRSYAASITPQRADDVTQDAFTKAFLALRGSDKEIQLRPWLYRIVRNTALTDIRDQPDPTVELGEAQAAGVSPEELAEQRDEIKRLIEGLRELPEPQRAAIVMRELEGLSHEQIAKSLGLSGGAVRQQIYRARRALREGVGILLPMPVLRVLLDQTFAHGASAAAAGGGGGIAVKAGVAAVLAAGTVTTGAILNGNLKPPSSADATPARTGSGSSGGVGSDSGLSGSSSAGSGRGRRADGGHREAERRGTNSGSSSHGGDSGSGHSGSGSSGSGSGSSGSGSGSSGSGSSGSGSGTSGSGSGTSGSGSGSGSGGDDALLDGGGGHSGPG